MSNDPASGRATSEVPSSLQRWFVLHFAIDILVALPIFVAPRETLGYLGWVSVDPMAARLAAAALFGIGMESWLGRNAGVEAFRGMLQLKIMWSGFAAIGIVLSILDGSLLYPIVGWLLFVVFAAFHALWWYWRVRLERAG